MKCYKAEKSILLQDSGELGNTKTASLEKHLAHCAACRQFRQALQASTSVFGEQAEPSAKSVQNVLRAARINVPVRKPWYIRGWKPELATVAASLFIAVGLFLGYYNPNRVGLEMLVTSAQLLNAEDQVISVMYDGLSEDDLAFNFLMTYEGNDTEG